MKRVWAVVAVAVASFGGGAEAWAQSPRVDGAPWHPTLSVDPNALPYVEGTLLPGYGQWNVSLAATWARQPLTVVADGVRTPVIAHQVWSVVTAQVGLSSRLALALQSPILLYQTGASVEGAPAPSAAGVGDLRAVLRWSTRAERNTAPGRGVTLSQLAQRRTERREGFGLSLQLAGTAPVGGDARGYVSAGAPTLGLNAVGDVRLARILGAVSLGYTARFDGGWPGQSGGCFDPTSPACLLDVPLRDQITFGVAVRQPLEGLLALIFLGISPRLASASILSGYYAATWVSVQGALDARDPFGNARHNPVEMAAGLQSNLGEWTLTAGAAWPLTSAPGPALPRVLAQVQWAPRFVDEDRDGLRDDPAIDRCIGLAEDFDGFEDDDGCPEDNDHDAIPDEEDRCPFEDEDEDGFEDEDGCPDPDNDRDGVLDVDDQCPNEAAGDRPDLRRRGCPDRDRDGDGVANDADRCPDEAPTGPHDPARPGCPAGDRDGDGIDDVTDACPDEPAGAAAARDLSGCPDVDPDRDGVYGADDACPEAAETLNGVRDEDGCPEVAARPGAVIPGARSLARVVRGPAGTVPSVELLAPVRFDARDAVVAGSRPVLAQLAWAVRAVAAERIRVEPRGVARRLVVVVRVPVTEAAVRGPGAVDAARAQRRRDAVLTALRALGATEAMVEGGEAGPAETGPVAGRRGLLLEVSGR